MKRNRILPLLLVAGLFFLAAACGSQKKRSEANGEMTEASQVIAIAWAESDSTQVEVMYDYVMPALECAFPDVTFEYLGITTDKAKALETLSATGGLTDIYCSDSCVYETLLAAGDFLDLAPYLETDGWLEGHYANPELLYSNGTVCTISCGQNDYYTPVVYYNADLFAELELEEPETMKDFMAICRKLNDNGIYPLTISAMSNALFMPDLLINSYDPEALNDLHARRCDWTDQRVAEAMKVFDQLKRMGAFTPSSATKGDADCLAEFASGKVAMWPAMSWYNNDVAEVDFHAGSFTWPSGNSQYESGYQQLHWGSVYGGWAINPEAEDVDTCVEVLKVILAAEAQRHADNGLSQNFIVEDTAGPINALELERMENYEKASKYRTLLFITGMDSTTVSEYTNCWRMLVSDDLSYLTENFIADFTETWEANTRAPD